MSPTENSKIEAFFDINIVKKMAKAFLRLQYKFRIKVESKSYFAIILRVQLICPL
jgi:hypothetical protein